MCNSWWIWCSSCAGKQFQLNAGMSYPDLATLEAFDAFGNRAWLVDGYSFFTNYTISDQTTNIIKVFLETCISVDISKYIVSNARLHASTYKGSLYAILARHSCPDDGIPYLMTIHFCLGMNYEEASRRNKQKRFPDWNSVVDLPTCMQIEVKYLDTIDVPLVIPDLGMTLSEDKRGFIVINASNIVRSGAYEAQFKQVRMDVNICILACQNKQNYKLRHILHGTEDHS